ncbi:MAG TPA: hypothetical protein PLB91_15665 [Spirochaetales bacterium]|nr:hypothetical protein [Spirochaetales bacterium]
MWARRASRILAPGRYDTSIHFPLFRARSPKAGPSLAEALYLLLGPGGPAGAARRRGPAPRLESPSPGSWSTAAAAASGELLVLRRDLSVASAAFLAAEPGEGSRGRLMAAAAALAELAGGEAGFLASAGPADAAAKGFSLGRLRGGRRLAARGGEILVFLDEALAAAAEARLAAEPGLLEKAVQDLGPGIEAARARVELMAPPERLGIDRSLDFALSSYFLPSLLPSGPAEGGSPPLAEVALGWDELAAGAAPAEGALWFAGSLGESRSGLALAFECPQPPGTERGAYAQRLLPVLRRLWAQAAGRLGEAAAGGGPRFGLLERAPEALLRGALRVSGEARLGSGGFALAAWLPPPFLAALRGLLRAEGPGREGLPGGLLAELVALNDELLMRGPGGGAPAARAWGAPELLAGFLRPRPLAGSAAPPLAGLLAALGRREGGLALQNCLLPAFGPRGLPYLFYYREPASGGRPARVLPFFPLREAELLGFLPGPAREEWARERRLGLPSRRSGLADCSAANEEGARLLLVAARSGRLELAPASRALLEEAVGRPLAAAARGRLQSLAAEDIPFGFLAGLGRKDAARIVDRLPNRRLALASVGDRRHLELLRSAMAMRRRRDFDEELEVAEARLERGETGPEAAAAAKLELLEEMRRVAGELARERAAEGASGGPSRRARAFP